MMAEAARLTGGAGGVPFLAVPPDSGARPSAPVVVAWHLMDPPRTEEAFAAALPLAGLDAWRIYLGLPMSGSRMPAGGPEELERLAFEDAVLNVQGPVPIQAAEEFAPAFAELRERLDLGDGPVGLLGGSSGSLAAQLVLAEGDVPISAAVLVSPLVQLRPAIDSIAKQFGFSYPWSDPALAVAERLDFVERADEIARRQPGVLLVVGEDDDRDAVLEPAERLRDTLTGRYTVPGRVGLVTVSGMEHALAEEPGVAAAPQTAHAAEVDRHAVAWLRQHLTLDA